MNDKQAAEYEMALRDAEIRASESKVRSMQQDALMIPQEQSMIREQLDLGEELERIDYLLRGYVLETNPETQNREWVKPKDNDFIILSDYGVHLIRNTIAWYINKNTLLSNYDEDTIRHKMEDFASDLNDTVFMEYEKVFQYPSFEDCKQVLNLRIENKKQLRIYALEILGKKLNDYEKKKVGDEILKELEPIIARELEKIKSQIMKNKLKRFLILIREIQDAVHSTYLRAWNGQERKTLREHIHISESKGGPVFQNAEGGHSILDYFRRK